MKTLVIETKKQLQIQGWIFITLGGGAISASLHKNKECKTIVSAKTLKTLRKRICIAKQLLTP